MRTFPLKPKATRQTTSDKSTTSGEGDFAHTPKVGSILHLQRTVGNQAAQRMFQTDAGVAKADFTSRASLRLKHHPSPIPLHSPPAGTLQTKLAINKPGDRFEQEADRMADEVMRMPEPQIERACPSCGGGPNRPTERQNPIRDRVQAVPVRSGDLVQSAEYPFVNEVLAAPGQPLDSGTRGFMEPRFGHGFGEVRVHTDEKAAASARAVNALAYTVGHNIVFGPGQYALETTAGRRLLAHELAHVVQQDQRKVRNSLPVGSLQKQEPPAPPFDWRAAVRQAESDAKNPSTKANAETTYKNLIVRAAANITAGSPLVDRKPTVADIRWDWKTDPQHPHGAEMDGKLIDNHPNDYWKWIRFLPGAVKESGPLETEETILHELDHASHAKMIYDNWLGPNSPGGHWDDYWVEHVTRWTEPAIVIEGGLLKGIAGLPETIRPSAIEFRAYASDLVHNFHQVDRNRQAYLARTVVLFYPLQIQAVAGQPISDPSLDLRKIRLKLQLYYAAGSSIIKTLLAYEMHNALLYRTEAARAQIQKELTPIFNTRPTSEEMRTAAESYVPSR